MDNSPKTISFRGDEKIWELLENIKKEVFDDKKVSNSEILRYALDFLYTNHSKEYFDWDEFEGLMFSYIKGAFLLADRTDFKLLDSIVDIITDLIPEHTLEEMKEVASLYNEDEPITVAKIIRFKNRLTPITFLKVMGVSESVYGKLNDDEIAELIMVKFTQEEFKREAKRLFHIDA